MKLYRRVVRVLVPTDRKLPRWNRYWSILETIRDEKKIAEYDVCEDYQYFCGAYMSPSKANYGFDYEFYKEE